MARPGLEPGTPRFSGSCTQLSNARESPGTTRLPATGSMNREVRKLHEIAGNVGHEVPRVSESPGCGHTPVAARGGASADPGLEETPLLARQPLELRFCSSSTAVAESSADDALVHGTKAAARCGAHGASTGVPDRMERDSEGTTAAFHGCSSVVGADGAPADGWSSSIASVSRLSAEVPALVR